MFEIGIISIIVLAAGYWVTLWLMSRHDDVLHGDFVHADDTLEIPEPSDQPAERPPFPPRPVIRRPAAPRSAINGARSAAAKPVPAAMPSTSSPAAPSAPASPRADRTETLQALLASIKRDLKDASQL